MKDKDLWMQDIEAMNIMNKKINELIEIVEQQKEEIERLKNKKNIFKKILDYFKR